MKKNEYRPPVLTIYRKAHIADDGEPFGEDDVRMIRREQERRRNKVREPDV